MPEDNLFEQEERQADREREPLATRIRPQTLDEIAGQQHLIGQGQLLRRLIESRRLSSAIFYGPPGTGKTTLARVTARHLGDHYLELSGVESTVAQLRDAVAQADQLWRNQRRRSLLLVDEIHRFNKAQQDALLPHVERGALRFVGVTTHNPFFYVNPALVSRSSVFEFQPLTTEEIESLLQRALKDKERGLGEHPVQAKKDALNFLANVCDGDARQALNALEIGILTTPANAKGKIVFDMEVAENSIQKRAVRYDKTGDAHYDTISAFIKSVRASEPDSALYWLAKMLLAGEDIRFIARRLVILASEDIGLADPQALPIAVAGYHAVEMTGMPEARIPLAETTVYLATTAKSNASYMALEEANAEIQSGRIKEVPKKLRSTAYKSAKKLGHGKDYQYAHHYNEAIAPELTLEGLPQFYKPTNRGHEKLIAERLKRWAKLRQG